MTETAAETNPVLKGINFEADYTKSLKIKMAARRSSETLEITIFLLSNMSNS